jgi:hypothetical protein
MGQYYVMGRNYLLKRRFFMLCEIFFNTGTIFGTSLTTTSSSAANGELQGGSGKKESNVVIGNIILIY